MRAGAGRLWSLTDVMEMPWVTIIGNNLEFLSR
jgi:hypothetical protein